MKRVLITGSNSYIGENVRNWLLKFPQKYLVNIADTMNGEWKKTDFSSYDVVFHVAGIAHTQAKADMEEIYYKVNCDLAVEVAEHAQKSGVKQFIFMSSIICYGNASRVINENTQPKPEGFYGKSKLMADERLHILQSESFNVVSVRPPMIYGKGSKGNYPRLSTLAKKIPLFPDFPNERSMLYIENLCECIRLIIDGEEKGFFYPQNREYVKTSDLVKIINPKIKTTRIFNPLIRLLKNVTSINKMFGTLVYDKKMSDCFDYKYCVKDFETSVKETEGIL